MYRETISLYKVGLYAPGYTMLYALGAINAIDWCVIHSIDSIWVIV